MILQTQAIGRRNIRNGLLLYFNGSLKQKNGWKILKRGYIYLSLR